MIIFSISEGVLRFRRAESKRWETVSVNVETGRNAIMEIQKISWSDYDAMIFDMDGTLVDSMWMWKEIDVEYLGRYGLEVPDQLQKTIEGMSFTETAIYFKEVFGIPDDLEKMKQDWNAMAYEKYSTQVCYKEGALKFLKWCKAQGKKMGVATSNSRELVNAAGKRLHFDEYFDCIMTSCEAKKGKPAPDIYLAVADRLQIRPERCLVFEDIPAGIMAGNAAGMTVVAVEDDYSGYMKEEKMKLAKFFIDSYEELPI